MYRIGLAGVLALWAGAAIAADEPLYAPPADWVQPLPIPKAAAPTDGSPTQMLLTDEQSKLSAAGDDFYVERAIKILSPQGFNTSGSLGSTWDPDTESLTIHHLHIIRGDTVIDALAGGKKFIVLRRENNLELAMLDGRLTATIQPEGLQVGDIVDMATTLHRSDPALKGYSSDMDRLVHTGVAARIRVREVWPANKPIRWRETTGLDAPKVTKTADGSELIVDMANVETPKAPVGAPARFADLGSIEFSQYADWTELSRLMSPLYQKAASLAPTSALQAEIARIAAASPDPKTRAEAALQLVQDQTRYVFLGMNDGGLVPADADVTWSRRFGDCKGKTTLLLALLRGLGIEAEPALVSTGFGDGLDQRLPMADWFDHVIIRAQIGGKTYWLDGTRVGDRRLDDLVVPPFHWALPVRPAGAVLVKLDPAPLTEPTVQNIVRIDASKGRDVPAPTHIEVVYRGEDAARHRQALASVPRSDFDRYLREFWAKTYPGFNADKVEATDDPAAGTARVSADGSMTMTWQQASDGARFYRVPHSAVGQDVTYTREPGPNHDAPYAVNYPYFAGETYTITLPTDGDFVLIGSDVDKTVAGNALHRQSRIDRGVLTVETTIRATAPEFPFSEAEAAGATLRDLAQNGVTVAYRTGAMLTPGKAVGASSPSDQSAAQAGDAAAQYRLGLAYGRGEGVPADSKQAMAWFQKSADQGYAPAEAAIGIAYSSGVGATRDYAQAQLWLRKAVAQNDASAQASLGYMHVSGLGVSADPAQAFALAKMSAAAGNVSGETLLGMLYGAGIGTPKDLTLAMSWIQKAADQGAASAQLSVARAYLLGMGETKDEAQAVAWARKAADQGDVDATVFLGARYAAGQGVAQDYAQAMTLFRKAADQNNADGELGLAALYYAGHGAPKDVIQSYDWVRKAANQGSAQGETELGWAYLQGTDLPRDYAQALLWLTKAADQGDATALSNLGYMYFDGKGVAADPVKAFTLAQQSAAAGNVSGEAFLGSLYGAGIGTPKDLALALSWSQKAADQGASQAQLTVARAYHFGLGVTKDDVQAVAWARKAADQGDADAEVFLGERYVGGQGVAQDYAQAMALYRKAVDQNNLNAELDIAGLYYAGQGVPKDAVQSYAWVRKAAEQGSARGENELGWAYEQGRDLPLDYAQALVWLNKAAAQGEVSAQNTLGTMYAEGQGVARDYAVAVSWYRKSADQGHASAEYNLGNMYRDGHGAPQSYVDAMTWYRKAADKNYTLAQYAIGSLYNNGQGVA